MTPRLFARIGLLLVLIASGLGFFASPAWAHNTLNSSTPADGATVAVAPTRLSLLFAKAVPLGTASVDLIDAANTITALKGLTHGAAGDSEVVVALPAMLNGVYTFRWRLVGSDGHPITGRVGVTVTGPPATTALPATPATVSASAAGAASAATTPTTTGALESVSTTSVVTARSATVLETPSTPSLIRWLLRLLSYLAMLVVGGGVATTLWVWPAAWLSDSLRQWVGVSLGTLAATAFAQLAIAAADIKGRGVLSSLGNIAGALQTDAGKSLAVRITLAGALGWLLYAARLSDEFLRWRVAVGLCVASIATWAFGGHAKSQRWPLLGVPLDVAHFAAAAAWLGGLGIIGVLGFRVTSPEDRRRIVQRFGRIARTCVLVLVATGVLQSLRLVGAPWRLFATPHGRWLVLKIVFVGLLLKVADVNRHRIASRFSTARGATDRTIDNLRRAMLTELALGLLIMATTAALVVAPPASADSEVASSPTTTTTTTTTTTIMTEDGSTKPVSAGSASTVAATPTVAAPVPTPAAPTTAALVRTTASAACTIRQPLAVGSTGEAVTCLQRALSAKGLLAPPFSGNFDPATVTAVRAYQTAGGLLVDGLVGPVTAQSLGIWSS